MTSEQRQRIRGLVKKYSARGTEFLIAYVAETDGMLAACQALLRSLDAVGSTSAEWLQRECAEGDVAFQAFLQEVVKIVALFQPNRDVEDHYAVLGLSPDAGIGEIKQAYRTLSIRYHPDTASPRYRNDPEKFIAINKAYHTLLGAESSGVTVEKPNPGKQWRQKRERKISLNQRRGVFIWATGLLLLLIVVSAVASLHLKKRAMLAGLQESRGAFIPQARKTAGASTVNSVQVEHQPADQPSSNLEESKIPIQDLVAKVEVVPPVIDSSSFMLKPLEQNDFSSAAELPASSNNDKRLFKQSVSQQTSLSAVDTRASGPDSVEKSNLKAPDEKSPPARDTKKDIPPARELAAKNPDRQTPAIKYQPVQDLQEADNPDPDVIFNADSPAAAATKSDVKIEKNAQPTQAAIGDVEPSTVDPSMAEDKQKKNDMQTRVDHFFADYINAYEQRNLILFSRFFEGEAEENGHPFTSILPTYLELFATTRSISLQVKERSWHLVDGMVAVDGQFKVDLEYTDSSKISGSGPIRFLLAENGSELLVRKMEYVFNTE